VLRSLKSLNTFYGFGLGLVVLFLIGPISVLAETFQTNVRVDDTGNNVINQYDPVIAMDDTGNIYVAWTDERNGHPDIYFAKSTDNGVTFTTNIKVNDANTSTAHAALTINDDGHILVAWQDERNGNPDIYFAKSIDNGASFGANVRVDDTSVGTSTQSAPTIGVHKGSGKIYITWTDERDSGIKHIYLAKSTNGGTSFGANIKIDDAGSITPDNVALVVDDNDNIYVAWKDERNGQPDVYFDVSTDGGVSFDVDVKVNDISVSSEYPALTVDELGNIYVVWQDERNGNPDIYFAKSTDGGANFQANIRVDDTGLITAAQDCPVIAFDGSGNLYSAWEDERNDNKDIYLAKNISGTVVFSTNIRVDDTGIATSEQTRPRIAIDNDDYLYVVWSDKRRGAGDSDIYFATTFPVTPNNGSEILTGSSGDDDSGKDWKCFIATAAYGTPMASDVVLLRRFRDKYLLTHPLGRIAVNTYYRLSPRMAEIISKNKTLRGAVRIGLAPLVGFARGLLNTRKNRRVSMISGERR